MAKKKRQSRKSPQKLSARNADKHELYEASVQDTSQDIAFIDRIFKKERGEKAMVLREDFCGTAKLCADWVASNPQRKAIGLDLHQPTMDWGTKRHVEPLGAAASRVSLKNRNVIDGLRQKVDVTVAFNFSYCALKQRADMKRYFANVRRDTKPSGVFLLDIHGGTETFEEMDETTRHRGFTYVWDQEPYDAVNGYAMRHIHFTFPDGSALRPAFTYDWRLWSLPELRDLLLEVGFSRVDVYWEGADEKGGGNGIFRRVRRADNEASWIAYIVAWKSP